jgi:type II secretory pathway component HofQ
MVYQSRIINVTRRATLGLVFLCLCGITNFAAVDESKTLTTGDSISMAATETATEQKPTPLPVAPANDKTPQSQSQGRQYGQPGFVGEPINLNVVNADIRDILNYITEQYGVNFVIDSSVGAVPVTVNVQDVPWNIALDAVLKANRLGVETNGNILRVATNEVLAKESETQKVINDSRLDAISN